jgi:nucleoside transporter
MVRLWFAFFFIAMAPGFWFPAITNILGARGLDAWVPWAFLAGPVASLLSPVVGGALADNRFSAEKLLGGISIGGAWLIGMAFYSLDQGWNPWWFIGFLVANAVVSAPMWGLLSTIALANLPRPERQFPLVRVGGTIGWILAGLMVSFLLVADTSPRVAYGTVAARVVFGLIALGLPSTPPQGGGGGWRRLLGGDALKIVRQRDHFVFFLTTGLVSVPLMAFYMYGPEHLRVLGDTRAAATMSIGQVSEIGAMLVIGWLMTRCRVKTMLVWALALALLRYVLFAIGGTTGNWWWLVAGVSLQGICYTFYFVTAQIFLNRRVEPAMRAQAQGLLVLVNGGIGSLIGTLAVGALHRTTILEGGADWPVFWSVLAGMVAVSLAVFVVFYRGRRRM